MTWTATERTDGIPALPGLLVTDIRDEHGKDVCSLVAYAKDHAAIEQMRARARLIVQAEAMRDGLAKAADALDLTAEFLEREGIMGTADGVRNDALQARAIIKATEYDTVDRADIGHKE